MPDNLDETIRENAQGPAKASGDAGSMEQHSKEKSLMTELGLTDTESSPASSEETHADENQTADAA